MYTGQWDNRQHVYCSVWWWSTGFPLNQLPYCTLERWLWLSQKFTPWLMFNVSCWWSVALTILMSAQIEDCLFDIKTACSTVYYLTCYQLVPKLAWSGGQYIFRCLLWRGCTHYLLIVGFGDAVQRDSSRLIVCIVFNAWLRSFYFLPRHLTSVV